MSEKTIGDNNEASVVSDPSIFLDSPFIDYHYNPFNYEEANTLSKYYYDASQFSESEIGPEIKLSRLYFWLIQNPATHEIFYTPSEELYSYLSIGYSVCRKAETPTTGRPVYRVYDPSDETAYYTQDNDTLNSLVNNGWTYDRAVFYSDPDFLSEKSDRIIFNKGLIHAAVDPDTHEFRVSDDGFHIMNICVPIEELDGQMRFGIFSVEEILLEDYDDDHYVVSVDKDSTIILNTEKDSSGWVVGDKPTLSCNATKINAMLDNSEKYWKDHV